jgi:aldehyde:ferredoxin oxidoreductase
VTGRKVELRDLITMSERVYNFQRIFALRMGFGLREHDRIPYRAMGPVTVEEYASRAERYDKQLKDIYQVNVDGTETSEKVKILRKFREQRYEELKDAVYKRRGWSREGIPTLETVRRLGIDFPEVLQVLEANGVKQ